MKLFQNISDKNVFSVGDFVVWKDGLKNRKSPAYGEPAIVTSILETPIFETDENDSASPYFRESLSIVIGVIREDDFLEFYIDSRRIELLKV